MNVGGKKKDQGGGGGGIWGNIGAYLGILFITIMWVLLILLFLFFLIFSKAFILHYLENRILTPVQFERDSNQRPPTC